MSRRVPDYLQPMRREVVEAVRQIAATYEPERERNPRLFRWAVGNAALKAVPPAPPGRRGSPNVKKAAQLRQQGRPWAAIYKRLIPRFGDLSSDQRRKESTRLRARVRAANSTEKRSKGQKSDSDICPAEM